MRFRPITPVTTHEAQMLRLAKSERAFLKDWTVVISADHVDGQRAWLTPVSEDTVLCEYKFHRFSVDLDYYIAVKYDGPSDPDEIAVAVTSYFLRHLSRLTRSGWDIEAITRTVSRSANRLAELREFADAVREDE